jgi:hypothetical protein
MGFTHLEVHSHFTLLGATPSVAELTARARVDALTHLALTDTNALYGTVAFARACRAAEIQPMIGMTLAVRQLAPPPPHPENAGAGPGQVVLLATGPAGYRSLCRLSSLIQGNPDREALAARGLGWDALAAHREGLICLSGGRRGWIDRYLRAGDYDAAKMRRSRRRWPRSRGGWGCQWSPCSRSTALRHPMRRSCGSWRRSGRMRFWTTPSTSLWMSRGGKVRNRKKRAKNRMRRDEILR